MKEGWPLWAGPMAGCGQVGPGRSCHSEYLLQSQRADCLGHTEDPTSPSPGEDLLCLVFGSAFDQGQGGGGAGGLLSQMLSVAKAGQRQRLGLCLGLKGRAGGRG